MNDKSGLVQKVLEMLKKRELTYRIDKYLDAKDLTLEEKESIKSEASRMYHDYIVEFLKKRNKIWFYIGVGLVIFLPLFFFFYLPSQNIVDNVGILSALGAFLLCLSIYLIFVFYHSWYPENIPQKPTLDFNIGSFFLPFIALASVPIVIFYFIIQYCIESGAEKILLETKVEATGVVIAGTYYESIGLRRKRPDDAEITVKFRTKDKKIITRTVEITPSQFNHFYKGQNVDLIYSSDNPNNMMLLNSKEKIQSVFKTEEREVVFDDLIGFIDDDKDQITNKLKKIAYGWKYDESRKSWINLSKDCAIRKQGAEILFFPRKETYIFLEHNLRKGNYIKVDEEGNGVSARYKKDNYILDKMFLGENNRGIVFYRIYKY